MSLIDRIRAFGAILLLICVVPGLASGEEMGKKNGEKAPTPSPSSYGNLLPGKDVPLGADPDEAAKAEELKKAEDKRWLKPGQKPKVDASKKPEKKPTVSMEASCVDENGKMIPSSDPLFAACVNRKSAQGNQDAAGNPAVKPGVTVHIGK